MLAKLRLFYIVVFTLRWSKSFPFDSNSSPQDAHLQKTASEGKWLFLLTGNRMDCGISKTPSSLLDDVNVGGEWLDEIRFDELSESSGVVVVVGVVVVDMSSTGSRISFLTMGCCCWRGDENGDDVSIPTFGDDSFEDDKEGSVLIRLRILSSFCLRMMLALDWSFVSAKYWVILPWNLNRKFNDKNNLLTLKISLSDNFRTIWGHPLMTSRLLGEGVSRILWQLPL